MKEFDCKVSSSCSACDEGRAGASRHRHLGKDRKEELSQLDYNSGTREDYRPLGIIILFSSGYMKSHTSKPSTKGTKS